MMMQGEKKFEASSHKEEGTNDERDWLGKVGPENKTDTNKEKHQAPAATKCPEMTRVTNVIMKHECALPLPLSTSLLPMIHVAATVVLKQNGDLLKLKLFLECQRNNYLYVGHVLRVWFEGMPAAIGRPEGGT